MKKTLFFVTKAKKQSFSHNSLYKNKVFVTTGKFDDFVQKSSLNLNAQTVKRVKGAMAYNEKVDAIMSYLFYANNEKVFSYENCFSFVKFYEKQGFDAWDEDDLHLFIKSGRNRVDGGSKAIVADSLMAKNTTNTSSTDAEES